MELKRVRLYAWLSLGAALVMLSLALLFALTLSYQTYRDGEGRGLHVLSQFVSSPMKGKNLAITSPFDKGLNYYDRDSDRKLIEEMMVRYYLELRYSFISDQTEMMRRWGWSSPLRRISTRRIHEKVVGNDLEERIRKKNGDIETVNILNITPNSGANQYSITMQINKIAASGQFESKVYKMVVGFRYNDVYKSFFREPVNPYGFYINYIDEDIDSKKVSDN